MQSAGGSDVRASSSRAVFPWGMVLIVLCVFLYALPAHAAASSLMWGNEDGSPPAQIEIVDGGTYTVQFNMAAPAFVSNLTNPGPVTATLYHLDDSGTREQVTTFHAHNSNGDPGFSWTSAGSYELDVVPFAPPVLMFNSKLIRLFAKVFFDIAYALSFGPPPETLHFTIQEAPPPCIQDCFDNVMFLPGIEASRLYRPNGTDEGNKIWEPSLVGHDNSQLAMSTGGASVEPDIYTKDTLGSVLGVDIYDSFLSTMHQFADTNGIEFEAFPYDWRYGADIVASSPTHLATTTVILVDEVKRLAAQSKTGKVTIIAHSNGGLVAKEVMLQLGADASRYVDKLIFVAVPQVGTPQAIAGLLHGYNQGIPVSWAPLLLTDAESRSLGQNMLGTYGLLPSAGYFTYVDAPVVTFAGDVPDWPGKYGDVIHSQESLRTFLTDAARTQPNVNNLNDPNVLSDTLLTQAEKLHQDIDAWAPPDGVQLIQIAGWGVPSTLSGIDYVRKFDFKKEAFVTEAQPEFTVDGDGTVVAPSALWVSTTTRAADYWVDLSTYNRISNRLSGGHMLDVGHAEIMSIKELGQFISDIVTNTTQALSNYTYLSTDAPTSGSLRLRYTLHSPLTLDLYDDLGNHTGVSTTTGQIEEQIPGTYFVQFGDVKYIFSGEGVPQHIVMSGYDTGTFTFDISEMQGDGVVASTSFENIPVTPQTKVTFDIFSGISSASDLTVDENGDGSKELLYASSTGQLIIPPPPAAAPPASSGGGNGPPVGVYMSAAGTSSVADVVATATATSTIIVASSTPFISTRSTSTATQIILIPAAPTVHRVLTRRPAPVVAQTSRTAGHANSQSQVAASAQTVQTGLWGRMWGWIMNGTRALFEL